MGPPPRRPIADLAAFFMGPRNETVPDVATPPPEQTDELAGEVNADDRPSDNIAGNTTSEEDVFTAEIDETIPTNEKNSEGETVFQIVVNTVAERAEASTSDSTASVHRTNDNNADETSMETITANAADAGAPLSAEISNMMDEQFALPDSRRAEETVSDGDVSAEENLLVIDENPSE